MSTSEKTPQESSLNPVNMPTCRIIHPSETIEFNGQTLENIDDKPFIACENLPEFSEDRVLEQIQKQPFYKDYAKKRNHIISKCQIEQKLPQKRCESQKYIKEHLHLQTLSDPFDVRNATNFRNLYISSLFKQLYSPSKNENGDFVNKPHIRAIHYKLLSEGIGFPVYENGKYQLKRYDGSDSMYNMLNESIVESWNAKLIPVEQIFDARTLWGPKPPDFELGFAEKDRFIPSLDFNLSLNKNHKIDVEAPMIFFYSEKRELKPMLDSLSQKYSNISHFHGKGFVSISNAYEIYQHIKKHSKNCLILTLTDYDETSLSISSKLAQKLQYHLQNDRDDQKASITVKQFASSPQDAEKFQKKGLEMGIKLFKSGDMKNIYMIPEYVPKLSIPTFDNISERNHYEQKTFGSKKKAKEALMKEATKMFQSKNSKTGLLLSLAEIGSQLGNRSESAIYKSIKESGLKTKFSRNYSK